MSFLPKTEKRFTVLKRLMRHISEKNTHSLLPFTLIGTTGVTACRRCGSTGYVKLFPKGNEDSMQGYAILNKKCEATE